MFIEAASERVHTSSNNDGEYEASTSKLLHQSSPDEVDEALERDGFWREGPRGQLPAVDHGPAVGVCVVALDRHRVLARQAANRVDASSARGRGAVVHGVGHGGQDLPAVQHVVVALGAVGRHHVQLTSEHAGAVVLTGLQHGRHLRPLVHAGVVTPHAIVEAGAVRASWGGGQTCREPFKAFI